MHSRRYRTGKLIGVLSLIVVVFSVQPIYAEPGTQAPKPVTLTLTESELAAALQPAFIHTEWKDKGLKFSRFRADIGNFFGVSLPPFPDTSKPGFVARLAEKGEGGRTWEADAWWVLSVADGRLIATPFGDPPGAYRPPRGPGGVIPSLITYAFIMRDQQPVIMQQINEALQQLLQKKARSATPVTVQSLTGPTFRKVTLPVRPGARYWGNFKGDFFDPSGTSLKVVIIK